MDISHGPLTRYIQLRVAHAPGMSGTFFSVINFKGNPHLRRQFVAKITWLMGQYRPLVVNRNYYYSNFDTHRLLIGMQHRCLIFHDVRANATWIGSLRVIYIPLQTAHNRRMKYIAIPSVWSFIRLDMHMISLWNINEELWEKIIRR